MRARPELPLRATIPEGNTVGQHADVDVGPSHRAIASSAGAEGAGADRGHRRIDAGDIDAGETWGTSTSAHRIEGEADPLLVVTDGAPGLIAGADPRRNGDDYPMTSLSDGLGPQKDPNSGRREASRRTLWSRCVAGPFCATTYGLLCDEVTCPWPVDPLDLPWHAEPFLP